MKKILKTPVWLLTLCMAVVVVFSLLANLVNTSAYQVKVENVKFETKSDAITSTFVGEYEGEMEGLLYTPKGCSKTNPCPVIVTTHGYLNSKEMQDAPSIELSKRGYIVLALDMYDHGDSTWETPAGFAFFMPSMWDAAKWAYEQEWALKDANGNGMIAVSGHSMGGYSTEFAVMFDTMAGMYGQGHQKIAVSLSVGADYRYSSTSIINMFGSRSSGMIIGHFDEFFGDPTDGNKNTVSYKDYAQTAQGKSFLGLAADAEAEAGKIYEYAGGQRVIYTPNETHPWNHFSTVTTGYMIDFYDQAFEYQITKAGLDYSSFDLEDGNSQTWWLKEAFECIAMIGLLAAIVPALALLLKVPFFAKVKTSDEALPVEKEQTKGKKVGLVLVALLTSLIPAYYFPQLISGSKSNLTMFFDLAEGIISIAILAAISAWIIYFVHRMVKGDENKETAKKAAFDVTKGALVVSFAALFLRFLSLKGGSLIPTNWYFNGPTTSQIAFWAVISAAISLVVLTIVHFIARRRDGATIKSYGLAANIKQVLLALLLAVILFVGVYAVVFLVGWLLNTDFRLWVYAIKSFEWHHFVSFVRYVPVYFVFYFVNSIVVAANTKDVKGFKGYLYAIGLNIAGLVLFLAYQYGKLFITGTAYVPSLALEGILLFGLVPSLAIAAIFAKKFYEKTNNIWTSAFFNTFLITMITIANTAIYLLAK